MNTASLTVLCLCVLVCLVSGCTDSARTPLSLNEFEVRLFAPYHVGDTVVFENSKRERDTIIVTRIDTLSGMHLDSTVFRPGLFEMVEPPYSVMLTIRHALNDRLENRSVQEVMFAQHAPLLTVIKTRDLTLYSFHFISLHAGLDTLALSKSRVVLNNMALDEYYVVEDPLGDSTDTGNIRRMYWTLRNGLVAYEYWNGDVFTNTAVTDSISRESTLGQIANEVITRYKHSGDRSELVTLNELGENSDGAWSDLYGGIIVDELCNTDNRCDLIQFLEQAPEHQRRNIERAIAGEYALLHEDSVMHFIDAEVLVPCANTSSRSLRILRSRFVALVKRPED